MFFELSLKGEKNVYYSLGEGSFLWNIVQSRPVVRGRGRGAPPTLAMERQFFQVLPKALDTAALLPC